MHLKSIFNVCSPKAYWTFESYSEGPSGNVYDEYGNYTLINQNAILGATGQTNHNFSAKSVNLKGGHMIVADGTFLQSTFQAQQFSVHFNFKTDTTVTGTKALIQKWDPDMQFWVGFENGYLTAKVATDEGLKTVFFDSDHDSMVYSGQWNHVILRLQPDKIYLYLNGQTSKTLTSTALLQESTLSQFTVGDTGGNVHTTDVFLNDLCFYTHNNDYIPLVTYKLPRSDRELWKNLNPKILMFVAESVQIDSKKPIPNEGSLGGYCYIQSTASAPPYMVQWAPVMGNEAAHLREYSWITYDGDINIDPSTNGGYTVLIYGQIDTADTNSSSNEYAHRYFDFLNDNDAYRVIVSDERTDSSYHWIGARTQDVNGTIVFQNNRDYYGGDTNRASYFDSINHYKFNVSDEGLYSACIQYRYWYVTQSYTDPFTYTNTTGYTNNKFMFNTNTLGYEWSRINTIAVCDENVYDSRYEMIAYPRTLLMQHFIQNHSYGPRAMLYGIQNVTSPQIRDWSNGPNYHLSDCQDSVTWSTDVFDITGAKQNEFTACAYLAGTYATIGQYIYTDGNSLYSNNFSLNLFARNVNSSSRYRFISHTYRPGNCSEYVNPSYLYFQVFMNSRDGSFSHGDLEIGWNSLAAGYTFSTSSQKLKDNRWHMLTITRSGTTMRLYIDGVLESEYVTSGVYDAGDNDVAWRFHGGAVYISEITYWLSNALPQQYIEFIFRGYSDVVKGNTTLEGAPIKARLFAVEHDTGNLVASGSSGDDGQFEFILPKDVNNRDLDLISLPHDETLTNHVVVHGPYNANSQYTRYVDTIFDEGLRDMVLDFNPIAYYPLDEATGTVATDASGVTGDGTYTNGVTLDQPGPEPESRSVFFERALSQYIDLPDGFQNFPNGFTIEAWVKLSDTPGNYERIVNLDNDLDNNDNNIVLSRASTTAQFNGKYNPEANVTCDAINPNAWQHVVFRTESDFTRTIWVDGTSKVTHVATQLPPNILRVENFIGRSSASGDDYLEGNVAHVAIYDYPLPKETIIHHHRRGVQIRYQTLKSYILTDGPIAYWTFDRLKDLTDEISSYAMTATGTYAIEKNALVINGGIVGNNYVKAPPNIHLNMTSTDLWTLECSVKIPGGTQTDAILVSEWGEDVSAGTFKLIIDSSNTFKFVFGTNATYLQSSTTYNGGDWHHIVVTYDNSTLKMYVDGTLEDSVSVSITNYGIYDFTVGNDESGDASQHLEDRGEIDDLALYDFVLNTVDIDVHYDAFLDKKETL